MCRYEQCTYRFENRTTTQGTYLSIHAPTKMLSINDDTNVLIQVPTATLSVWSSVSHFRSQSFRQQCRCDHDDDDFSETDRVLPDTFLLNV